MRLDHSMTPLDPRHTHPSLSSASLNDLFPLTGVRISRQQVQRTNAKGSSVNLVLKYSIPSLLLVTNIPSETKSRWLVTQHVRTDTALKPRLSYTTLNYVSHNTLWIYSKSDTHHGGS